MKGGNLQAIYLTGDYAKGSDSGIIDLILIGDIEREQLDDVVRKTEKYINRRIRPLILEQDEFDQPLLKGNFPNAMKLWSKAENNMQVIIDASS